MRCFLKLIVLALMVTGVKSNATLFADWTFKQNDPITTGISAVSFDSGHLSSATLTAQNVLLSGSPIANVSLGHTGSTLYFLDYKYSSGQNFTGSGAAVVFQVYCTSSLDISGLSSAFTYSHGPTAGTMAGIWTINGANYASSTIVNKNDSITNSIGNVNLAQGLNTITFSITGAPSGTNSAIELSEFRLEYNSITEVPEPIQYALAGFTFVLIGVGSAKYANRRNKPVVK